MTTPHALLAAELSRDGSRPLLTWYDDGTGERVELSVATTANWAAKVANLLVAEHDVQPGDTVAVLLPLHWETAVVLLACWSTGATVAFDGPGVVTFTSGAAPPAGGELVQLSGAAMGADLSRLVAAQPDAFAAVAPSGAELVESLPSDAPAAARVLTTRPFGEPTGLFYGLLSPLATGGSVVLVGRPDPGRLAGRCAVERVTHTVGVDVDGLPRLGS